MPPVETPSVAATPAAVPATPATPSPAPAPAAPPAEGRGSRLFGLLAAEADVPHGKKPDKKPEPAAAPVEKKADPAPAAPAPVDDKPIKATRKSPISKRPDLPTNTPAAPAPIAAPVAPKDDTDWEANLVDEEKQLIEDAKEAEKHLPTRKGLTDQIKKFVKENQKYLDKHPEIESDPDEKAAYDAWLKKNRPSLSESEQRTVSENRIAARVAQPFEEKTAKLEHELFVRDQEPVIRQQRDKVMSELNSSAMPQDILDFANKHGVDTARKEFADEINVVNTIVNAATSDYEELVRLSTINPSNGRTLSTEVSNPNDPKFVQHERLKLIISKVNDDFKVNAKEKDLLRDGKWFCTRGEWNAGYNQYPDQYWTFSNKEIATRSLDWVKPAVGQAIKQNQEAMAARGYERRKFVPPVTTPPAAPPQATRSAAPNLSPVPPSTTGVPKPATVGSRILGALTAD